MKFNSLEQFNLVPVVIIIFVIYYAKSDTAEEHFRVKRIVNGLSAEPGEAPYIVSLQTLRDNQTQHFCTGSHIGNGWILTASHCLRTM